MKHLLDTNVASDYLKGVPSVVSRVQNCHPADIAITTVTVMELSYGAKRRNSAKLTQAVTDFIAAVSILPLDKISGKIAGELRATMESQGTAIALADCQIAATARLHDIRLVTTVATCTASQIKPSSTGAHKSPNNVARMLVVAVEIEIAPTTRPARSPVIE